MLTNLLSVRLVKDSSHTVYQSDARLKILRARRHKWRTLGEIGRGCMEPVLKNVAQLGL